MATIITSEYTLHCENDMDIAKGTLALSPSLPPPFSIFSLSPTWSQQAYFILYTKPESRDEIFVHFLYGFHDVQCGLVSVSEDVILRTVAYSDML